MPTDLSLVASLVGGALVVRPAAEHADALVAPHPGRRARNLAHAGRRYSDALDVRVSGELWRAGAELAVSGGRAEGVHAARLRVGAGVAAPARSADLVGLAAAVCVAGADGGLDAPVVLALLVPGTIPVPVALLGLAALVGVPVVPGGAAALGLVVAGVAAGVLAADVGHPAHVLAAAPARRVVHDAGLAAGAVAVALALVCWVEGIGLNMIKTAFCSEV